MTFQIRPRKKLGFSMSAMPARVSYDVDQGTLGEKCVAGAGCHGGTIPEVMGI